MFLSKVLFLICQTLRNSFWVNDFIQVKSESFNYLIFNYEWCVCACVCVCVCECVWGREGICAHFHYLTEPRSGILWFFSNSPHLTCSLLWYSLYINPNLQILALGILWLIRFDYRRNSPKEVSESGTEHHQTSNVYGSKEGPQEDTCHGKAGQYMISYKQQQQQTNKHLEIWPLSQKVGIKMYKLFSNLKSMPGRLFNWTWVFKKNKAGGIF